MGWKRIGLMRRPAAGGEARERVFLSRLWEKAGSCTKSGGDCAFSRRKGDFCTIHGRDCAFLEGKGDFCTIHGRDCAFSTGKGDF